MRAEDYETILIAYRGGRVTDGELHRHMTDDPLFRTYVLEALKRRERGETA